MLDAALQVAILAVVNMVEAFEDSLMPTFVREILVSKGTASEEGHIFRAGGQTWVEDPRHFLGDSTVADLRAGSMEPVMSIKGAKFVLTSALKGSNQVKSNSEHKLCWNTVWKPDATFVDQSVVQGIWGMQMMDSEEIASHALVEKAAYFSIKRAIDALTDFEQQNLLSHHQHYLKRAYESLKKGDAGTLRYQTADWQMTDEKSVASTLEQASQSGAPGRMISEAGR